MAEIERQARARREARAFERRAQAARAEAFRRMRRDREEFAQSSAGWRWRQVDDARSRRPVAEATTVVAARTPCSA